MVENKYWFARRFPLTDPRNSMSPVTPEGFAVAWTFIGWMLGGAAAAIVLLGLGGWAFYAWGQGLGSLVIVALAPIAFVGCTIYGAWYFITQSRDRGDHRHTIEDYKQGRV